MSDLLRLQALLDGDRALYDRLDMAARELRLRKLLRVPETKDCRQMEVKHFSAKLADWAAGTFDAYASDWSIDRQNDRIERGAFALTIAENGGKVPLCWMHDRAAPVGVAEDLVEDDRGLRFRGKIARKSARGEEALELLAMGALKTFSIGFFLRNYREEAGIRVLTDIDLGEVSVVSIPANPRARTV